MKETVIFTPWGAETLMICRVYHVRLQILRLFVSGENSRKKEEAKHEGV